MCVRVCLWLGGRASQSASKRDALQPVSSEHKSIIADVYDRWCKLVCVLNGSNYFKASQPKSFQPLVKSKCFILSKMAERMILKEA